MLLSRQPPHGAKPDRQRGPRVLKNRSRRHRSLTATTRALQQYTSHRPRPTVPTVRTAKTIWPSQPRQVRLAALLCAEVRFEFRQVSRIFFHHPAYYILGLPESSGYPPRAIVDAVVVSCG